jgi:hypothetical protein
MNKACILLPYFGKWPPYMDVYLKGCANNPNVDFIFFTDAGPLPNAPDNVKLHPLTLKEFNALVSKQFNITARIESAYKVCDVRPAFGLLFEEFIKSYDFWGWGDIDLVYGRLDAFFTSNHFKEFDILSGRKFWVSGALCFIRNTPEVNTMFLENEDYKANFTRAQHTSFSECGKKWSDVLNGRTILELDFKEKNFTRLVAEWVHADLLKAYFEDMYKESIGKDDYVHFSNGKLSSRAGQEFALFHYVMTKRNPWFKYPKWKEVPDEFYITPTGFYTANEFTFNWYPVRSLWRKASVVHLVLKNYWSRAVKKIHSLK